jgi:glycosyltransferase involved in cell wall biosynthesis
VRIVLINHYAGSLHHGMEYRPYYFAREWRRLGHEVTIVAASCSHVRTTSPVFDGALLEENIEGLRYVWLRTPRYDGNGLGRAVNMLAFVWQLWRRRTWLATKYRPDVVVASSTYPLDNLPAHWLAHDCKAQLVYEVHDLWPLSPIELGGMSRWHPFILVMQWAENFACRHAHRVVSMLPCAADHMRRHGMAPEKFVHVPNGVDTEEWEVAKAALPQEHGIVLARLRAEGRFIVGYAGAHGLANSLHSLVEAAKLLVNDRVGVVLVGQGPMKESLQRQARSSGLNNLVFLPPVGKAAVPALLSAFDVCYIGLKRTPLFRFGISPNKLLDYMMAGRPIIQAIDAGNDMVKEVRCGLSIPPEDPKAIAGAIGELISMTTAMREEMGLRGRQYVLANHDYRVLAARFLQCLRQ